MSISLFQHFLPHAAFVLAALLPGTSSWAAVYYIDSVSGSDSNTGASPASALASFSKLPSSLSPGDRVYLKRGSRWKDATLLVTGQGTAASPIVVDAYGDPDVALPVIDGSAFLGDGSVGIWEVERIPVAASALSFGSDWESGDLADGGRWSQIADPGSILSISSNADPDDDDRYGVISGGNSLRITKSSTTNAYLQAGNIDTGPDGEFYLRFTFRHLGRHLSDEDAGFVVLKLLDAAGDSVIEIGFNPPNSDPKIKEHRLLYFNCWKCEQQAWTFPHWLGSRPTLERRPHIIELHYKPESAPGARDGVVEVRLDGRTDAFEPGFVLDAENNDVRISQIRVGLMDGQDVSVSPLGEDVFWIDDVAIGPASEGWLKSTVTVYRTPSPIETPNADKWHGQVWNNVSGENLNNGDAKSSNDPPGYLLEGEFAIAQDGTVWLAPRGGTPPTASSHIITSKRSGVILNGSYLTVRNVRTEYQWHYGVLVQSGSANVVIEDNEIRRTGQFGIKVLGDAKDTRIANNKIWEIGGMLELRGSGFGVHAGWFRFLDDNGRVVALSVDGIDIVDNTIWDCGAWANTDYGPYRVPTDGFGIEVDNDSTRVLIARNTISLTQQRSRLWWDVLAMSAANAIHLEGYRLFGAGHDIVIRNNLLANMPAGIQLNIFNTAASIQNNTFILPPSGYFSSYSIRQGSEHTAGNWVNVILRNNLFYTQPGNTAGLPDKRRLFVVLENDLANGRISSDYNLVAHPENTSVATTTGDEYWRDLLSDLSWTDWMGRVNGVVSGEMESINDALFVPSPSTFGLPFNAVGLNQGLDVGLPFYGTAPDMGYREGEVVEIPDGDMESVGTGAWSASNAVIVKSDTTVRAFSRSLRVEGFSVNGDGRAEAAPLSVQTGEQYQLSAWVYATSVTSPSGLAVRDLANNRWITDVRASGANVTVANKWTRLETTFIVPEGVGSVGIWLMNQGQGVPAYFDDVHLARLQTNVTTSGPGIPVDSNGDGLSDADAVALGLDPNDPDGDTDDDGLPDVQEVGGDASNPRPVDRDSDGVIDALEPGVSADNAAVADGLRLSGGEVATVTISGGLLSNVSIAEVSAGVGPAGISFPFGMLSYTASSTVGGSVRVQLTFSSDLPADLVLYKVDSAGRFTELAVSVWAQIDARTIELVLTDGDPLTDQDGMTNGSISDPVAPGGVTTASSTGTSTVSGSSGGGGGGCTINASSGMDPVWLVILLVSGFGCLRHSRYMRHMYQQ